METTSPSQNFDAILDPDRFLLPENPAFWPRPATPQEREQFALYKEYLIGSDVAADLAATTYLAVFPQ